MGTPWLEIVKFQFVDVYSRGYRKIILYDMYICLISKKKLSINPYLTNFGHNAIFWTFFATMRVLLVVSAGY
jgi:hypothetical protein